MRKPKRIGLPVEPEDRSFFELVEIYLFLLVKRPTATNWQKFILNAMVNVSSGRNVDNWIDLTRFYPPTSEIYKFAVEFIKFHAFPHGNKLERYYPLEMYLEFLALEQILSADDPFRALSVSAIEQIVKSPVFDS